MSSSETVWKLSPLCTASLRNLSVHPSATNRSRNFNLNTTPLSFDSITSLPSFISRNLVTSSRPIHALRCRRSISTSHTLYWIPRGERTSSPLAKTSNLAATRQSRSISFSSPSPDMASATGFYDFKPLDKKGQEVPLTNFKGKVVLVVNTASNCSFTPQYAGLEALHKKIGGKYGDDFAILAFPCNQFGNQEPGTDDDVQQFCQANYGVSFPVMGKTDVNGDTANPLFTWLKEERPGIMGLKRIKWNFEKFLVGRDGAVKGRWATTTKPEGLEKTIVEELEKKA